MAQGNQEMRIRIALLFTLALLMSPSANARCPTLPDLSWTVTSAGNGYTASFQLRMYSVLFWSFVGTVEGDTIRLSAHFNPMQLPPPIQERTITIDLPSANRYNLVLQGFRSGAPASYCPAETAAINLGTPSGTYAVDAISNIGVIIVSLLVLLLGIARHQRRV